MVEGHFTLGAGSWTDTGGPDEHGHAFPGHAPQLTTQFSSAHRTPPPLQWSPALIPEDHDFGDFDKFNMRWVYERASGTEQAVNAITLTLDQQHLESDVENSLPTAQISDTAACVATSSRPPIHASNIPDISSKDYSFAPGKGSCTAVSRPPNLDLSALHQRDSQNTPITRPPGTSDIRCLRRTTSQRSPATLRESFMQDMVCSGTHCKAQAPSSDDLCFAPVHDLDNRDSTAALEVDQFRTDDSDVDMPHMNSFLAARQAMKPAGISKTNHLAYRSSVDTALLCENLVRNKPRMRKRIKVRKKVRPPDVAPPTGFAATLAGAAL